MEGTETVGGSRQMNAPIFGSETMIVVQGWILVQMALSSLFDRHQDAL